MDSLTILLKARDEASKVFGKARSSLGDIKSQAVKVADGLKKTGGEIATFGASMTVVGGLMLAPFVASVPVFANFDDAMRGVGARAIETEHSLDDLSGQAKKLGSETAHSASAVADGMGFLAQAGWETTQIFEGIPHILSLASASNTDLARTADITSNVISGFALDVEKDSQRVADVLAKTTNSSNTNLEQFGEAFKVAGPLASAAKWEFEETAAAIGILGNAGIQGSAAGTGLNQVIARLSDTSSASAKKLDEMGISALDSGGNLRGLDDILEDLDGAGASVSDTLDIFGLVAGPKLQAMMNQGTASLKDLQVGLEDAEGTAQKTADEMEAGLGGGMRQVMSAIEGVQIELGEALAPALLEIIPHIQEFLLNFINFVSENPGIIKAVAAIGAGLVALGGFLTTVGGFMIWLGVAIKGAIAIFGALSGMLSIVIGIFKAVGVVIAFLTGPIGLVILAIVALIAIGVALWQNWDWVKAKAGEVWDWIGQKISAVWEWIKTATKVGWDAISGFFTNGINKAKSGVEKGIGNIKNVFKSGMQFITGLIAPVIDQIRRLGDMAGGLKDKVAGGLSKIPGFAVGTSHFSGGAALVGERGPEVVNLPAGSKVQRNEALSNNTQPQNKIEFSPNINFSSFTKPNLAEQKEMADSLEEMFLQFLKKHKMA